MTGSPDLLSLIGSAIEKLRRSIDLFDAAQAQGGVEELSAVCREIDDYLARIDDDPLLKLAPLDRGELEERLHEIEGALSEVITGVHHAQTSDQTTGLP